MNSIKQVGQPDFIHVRLREGREDDIADWYKAQADKSRAVRTSLRVAIRLQNGNVQGTMVKDAVSRELARLPDIVAAAVRDALSAYQLVSNSQGREPGTEDPELAARLDAQLDEWSA